MNKLIRIILAGIVTLGAVAVVSGPQAQALTPFVVYMASDGDDANSGLTAGSPVKTLARVQDVLYANDPQTDVEVRIEPGTYRLPSTEQGTTSWDFYVPGYSVSFAPTDYVLGEPGWTDRPVFDGDRLIFGETYTNGTNGWWLNFNLPDSGGSTKLHFYYLDIRHFVKGGIAIIGGADYTGTFVEPTGNGANENLFYGMKFYENGSLYNNSGSNLGFGSIDLVHSSDNTITNNHFIKQENKVNTPCGSGTCDYRPNIHGVYLAHFSDNSLVEGNNFDTISGDPVNVRDASNFNYVSDNSFTNAGDDGFYNEWFCTSDVSAACSPQECTSHGNEFRDNTLYSGYDGYGGTPPVWIPAFDFHWPKDSEATPAEQVVAQRAGCYPITMPARLATSGNDRPWH